MANVAEGFARRSTQGVCLVLNSSFISMVSTAEAQSHRDVCSTKGVCPQTVIYFTNKPTRPVKFSLVCKYPRTN